MQSRFYVNCRHFLRAYYGKIYESIRLTETIGSCFVICFSRLGNLGRLGNQLFQVAATIAAAERCGVSPKFPAWKYAKYFAGPFDQSLTMEEISDEYMEPSAAYSAIPCRTNVDLFGFFQCEKYFIDQELLIRSRFKIMDSLLPAEYENCDFDCAIHVRRGDYTKESHRFVPLQMDYYNRAMTAAREKGLSKFVVCSDDPDWCAANFPGDVHVVRDLDEIQTLCFMSRIPNHIIANSTLSWWSSWLCSNPAKLVFAPKIWYAFNYSFCRNTDYQYCDNWQLIPHSISITKQISSLVRSREKERFFLAYVSREKWLEIEHFYSRQTKI